MKLYVMKLLTVTLLVIAMVCNSSCRENHEPVQARQVRGVTAVVRDIPDEAGGFGTLSFVSKLDITAPHEGLIKRLYYREGSFVPGEQDVILMENPQIALALARAENNFSQAKAASDLARSRLLEGEFLAEAQLLSIKKAESELVLVRKKWEEHYRKQKNQETLFNAGGINEEAIRIGRFNLEHEYAQILILEKELEMRHIGSRDKDLVAAGILVPEDEAEKRRAQIELLTAGLRAELGVSLARLEAAEKELLSARIINEDLLIKSQAAGVVGARYFEEGERVKAGEKILTLMDTSSLYAIFQVREKDALRIEKGMAAKVQIDGIGTERQGTVDLVYPQADSQSLSFLVRVLLDGETGELKPGMFSRVQVILGPPRQGIFLPASALAGRRNSEAEVFVINGNTLSGRKVVLGQAQGDHWEICSGIKAGEIAVQRPDSDMREGTLVSLAN